MYHQPAATVIAYANEATVYLWYNSVAILIRIPKWSDYRQKLIVISTEDYIVVQKVKQVQQMKMGL